MYRFFTSLYWLENLIDILKNTLWYLSCQSCTASSLSLYYKSNGAVIDLLDINKDEQVLFRRLNVNLSKILIENIINMLVPATDTLIF